MKPWYTLILLICFLIIYIPPVLSQQAPAIEWQKCLGGSNGEFWPRSIEPTPDGGFIVGGTTEGADGDVQGYHGNIGIGDIWIVKLNSAGAIQWQKCIGGNSVEYFGDMHQTPDGGYIVLGSTASIDCVIKGSRYDVKYWVVKLNATGDIEWQNTYGSSENDYANSIAITKDGGYIACGYIETGDGDVTGYHGNLDYWVIKVDAKGKLQWQKALGGSDEDIAYSVQATDDGGGIVAGYATSTDGDVKGNHGKRDAWIVKLDNKGTIQWQKSIGGSNFEEASSIQKTPDGGYIVAGYANSNDGDISGVHNTLGPSSDFLLVKLSSTGAIQWQKCYGGQLNERANYVQNTPDGGYVLAGYAESNNGDVSCNAGYEDSWVVKTDSKGILQWQKSMGGDGLDEAFCVQPLQDGSYIVAADVCSHNVTDWHVHSTWENTCTDYWIVKLSAPANALHLPAVSIQLPPIICPGVPATVTAAATYTGTNPTYSWKNNGIAVGTNSAFYTTTDLKENDLVECAVISGGNCISNPQQANDSKVIHLNKNTIHPAVTIAASDSFVCNCTPVLFSASVADGGAQPLFQWNINGNNTGFYGKQFTDYLPNPSNVITCTYRDSNACINAGYVLSNAITLQPFAMQAPKVTVTASVPVACPGALVTFTAAAQNAGSQPSYEWKVNGKAVGNNANSFTSATLNNGDIVNCVIHIDPQFSCATDATAVSNNYVVHFTDKKEAAATIKTTSDIICKGTAASFTVSTSNTGQHPTYEWRVNNLLAGASDTDSSFTSISLRDGDVVYCIVHIDPLFATCALSSAAQSNSITVHVTENNVTPDVSITASAAEVCAGTPVLFTAVATGAGTLPLQYNWKVNDITTGNNTNLFKTNTLHSGDEVLCEVSAGTNSCNSLPVQSNRISMVVNDTPVIQVHPADTIAAAGTTILLTAAVTGNEDVSFEWSPAAGVDAPFSLSPYTTPLQSTTVYTFTAANNKHCISSANVIIKVVKQFFMPNSFTPNHDGRNDVFRIPPNTFLTLHQFSVFDRWGRRIFYTQNINEGWNGSLNGVPLQTGTYIYVITGENEKGVVNIKGSFILMR